MQHIVIADSIFNTVWMSGIYYGMGTAQSGVGCSMHSYTLPLLRSSIELHFMCIPAFLGPGIELHVG